MSLFEYIIIGFIAFNTIILYGIWRAILGRATLLMRLGTVIEAHLKRISSLSKIVDEVKRELAALNRELKNER